MKQILKYQWDRMSDEEVIDFWEEHGYAEAYSNKGNVPGWGFSSMERLNNYYNCEAQMFERGLL